MSETDLDMSGLFDRINKIKNEGEEASDFTLEFLTCLMERHDLKYAIPDEFEIEDVPESIIDGLRNGELPTKEQIVLMSAQTQNNLLFDAVWVCGMNAVSYYTKDIPIPEGEDNILDSILAMLHVSQAHAIGCYLISVFTLLLSKVPSLEMIEAITDNFDESPLKLQQMQDMFVELSAALLLRWREDKLYYFTDIEE